MLTESSNSCQNRHHHHHHHHHHHRHQRHHHKYHRHHGRHKNSIEKSVSKKIPKCEDTNEVETRTEGCKLEEDSSERVEGSTKQERKQHHAGRVLRNRRYRRPFEDHRHTKRLFTPEIKKFLKTWLVRRRDNPYPSRDEKKGLAVQTGLTYIQICNWFANWRRKLKNAGSEAQHHTWGNLIKSYNTKAQGNVEQFSLCSDDSIWEEQDISDTDQEDNGRETSASAPLSYVINATAMDHSYSALFHHKNNNDETSTIAELIEDSNISPASLKSQNLSLTPNELRFHVADSNKEKQEQISPIVSNKYKNLIMEKYLTDLKLCHDISPVTTPKFKQRKSLHTTSKKQSRTIESNKDQGDICTNTAYNNSSQNQSRKNGCGAYVHKSKNLRKEEKPLELSKWIESAAKFKPGQNYVTWSAKNVTWQTNPNEMKKIRQWNVKGNGESNLSLGQQHQREELDAAEALTCLSTLGN